MLTYIQGISITEGKSCFYACVRNVFLNYRYNISEAEVFLLCGGLEISYERENRFIGHSYQLKQLERIPTDYVSRAFVRYLNPDEDCMDRIYSLLNNGKMIILRVDTGSLTYHEAYKNRTKSYPHFILMYGINREAGEAFIADSFILDNFGRVNTYKGPASLEDIIKTARAYGWIQIKEDSLLDNNKIGELLKAGLKRYASSEHDEFGNFKGHEAVRRYIQDLEDFMNSEAKDYAQFCEDFYYSVKIRVCLPALDYLTDLIKQKAGLLINNAPSFIEELERLTVEWNIFAASVLRAGKGRNRNKIPELLEKGLGVLEHQNKIFGKIVDYLK